MRIGYEKATEGVKQCSKFTEDVRQPAGKFLSRLTQYFAECGRPDKGISFPLPKLHVKEYKASQEIIYDAIL